jgi:hypothetical protein
MNTFPAAWPPVEHPLVQWTDRELIDQYTGLKPRFDEEDDTVYDDDAVGTLIQEIIRRGLDDVAEDA